MKAETRTTTDQSRQARFRTLDTVRPSGSTEGMLRLTSYQWFCVQWGGSDTWQDVDLLFFYEKSNCLHPFDDRGSPPRKQTRPIRTPFGAARWSVDSDANSFYEETDQNWLGRTPVGARSASGSGPRCPFLCCPMEQPSGGCGREVLPRGESLHATWHLSNSYAPARSNGWDGHRIGLGPR